VKSVAVFLLPNFLASAERDQLAPRHGAEHLGPRQKVVSHGLELVVQWRLMDPRRFQVERPAVSLEAGSLHSLGSLGKQPESQQKLVGDALGILIPDLIPSYPAGDEVGIGAPDHFSVPDTELAFDTKHSGVKQKACDIVHVAVYAEEDPFAYKPIHGNGFGDRRPEKRVADRGIDGQDFVPFQKSMTEHF
jgi:hypothetical protein